MLEIPEVDGMKEFCLANVTSSDFRSEQERCPDLQVLWGKARSGVDEEFQLMKGKLEVLFLGHTVGSGSRSPSDLKIKAIKDFPTPTTKTQVRSFLGIVGYYTHYISNYSEIAPLLTDALKGKCKKEIIVWDERCEKAFEELKGKLVSKPILFAPDFSKDFILQTDASDIRAEVVLSQSINGEEHPILFPSKKFSKAERNYSTVERELAAIIFGLKRLKHYLDGQRFIIETKYLTK
ncbi:retrovirus-related Pol polyprotein from transposon 17.6 [Trichonephila clavata]|uniref:RNA-directed DNA polymerase n=1 Tax=Trichonephila clavata TaxID=2740835 RepID=A0A8X6GC11_TRICU|nr:retrovirus-related Pol polyprotein from transposon 17.6 [Trichonephila clavata]